MALKSVFFVLKPSDWRPFFCLERFYWFLMNNPPGRQPAKWTKKKYFKQKEQDDYDA